MNKPSSTMTLEALRSVPLFSSLDDKSATELRELLRETHVTGKTRLFRAGEIGDAMYLIQSGRVQISIRDEDKNEVVLAELAQGDFFGEMSIIDGRQRSADASVLDDATLSVLSRDAFLSFVRTNPDVPLKMLAALSERLRRTDDLLRSRVTRNVNEEEKARQTFADRAADALAEFGGSWKFIGITSVFIIFWIVLNSYILINGLDPEVVVIGGEITKAWGVIEPIIVEETKRSLLSPRSHGVAIRPSTFEVRPSLKGALTLIQNNLLSVPHMG